MATLQSTPHRNADGGLTEDDFDSIGVINALERTCELESKLRQAIQQTHPLTTTLEWDFAAADREREALLAISEQLEYLEDKLREYRFLDQANTDQKAVILGQLDAVRRELLEVLSTTSPRVLFAKEIVKEVLLFATAGEETPRTSPIASSRDQKWYRGGGNPSPPLGESSLFSLMSAASPKPLPASQPSYATSYENDLFVDGKSNRINRDSLAVPVPGATTANAGGVSAGATRRYNGGSSTSSRYHISDEDIYGPPLPKNDSNTSLASSVAAAASSKPSTAPVSGSTTPHGGMLRIRDMLSRAERGLSAVAEAQEQRRTITVPRITGRGPKDGAAGNEIDGTEEWDGITEGAPLRGPPSTVTGGFITPREAEELASYWNGATTAGAHGTPYSVKDWTIKAEHTNNNTPYKSVPDTPGSFSDAASGQSSGGRSGNGLFGKIAGLGIVVLGSIAAATVVATGLQNAKSDNNNHNTNKKRNSNAAGRSTSSTAAAMRKKKTSSKSADMPPWLEGKQSSKEAAEAAAAARARRKATAGSSGSPSRKGSQQQQGPVMHVHQPPASNSFPQNPPPDVTAVMG